MATFSFANTSHTDMRYVVGKTTTDPFFFLEIEQKKYIFLNRLEIDAFRESNQPKTIEAVPLELFLKEARGAKDVALSILKKYELTTAKVPTYFPLDMADHLREHGIVLSVQKILYPERAIKSAEEIALIEIGLQKTIKAFSCIEQILEQSTIKDDNVLYKGNPLTSEFLKTTVENMLFQEKMFGSGHIIIASGIQGAFPHHTGSGIIRAHTPIVCDIFPYSLETGYFADMTRTYVKGTPSDEITRMYDAVLEAEMAAIEIARPGRVVGDVHRAAVSVFKDRGFDVGEKGFIHAIGHGIGLDIHEAPHLSETVTDLLEPGHVITIEPGLYYKNIGGVRIEDVIVITKDGNHILTNHPKRFVI